MAKMAKLERVLGCTACPSSFAIDQTTGMVAYAAGSTVVLITKNNGQFHFVNNSKNNITCITFSTNGKYLATGEFGNCPMVRVWEICKDGTFQGQQIAELKYHTLGVLCVKFTHDSTQLISVGIQHDKSVAVWDWRGQKKIAENRLTSQVNAMDISEDGNCFVTVGVRHVKFWMLNGKEKALSGRSAILAEQRNNTFLDICCVPGNRAFALTDTKLLVEFYDKKVGANMTKMNIKIEKNFDFVFQISIF
jgi:WD40 repeat protein